MLYLFVKRILDLLLAILALIILSPFLLLVALAVKIDSAGAVFVEDSDRVGKGGKSFRMYKFRTMIKSAHKQIKTNPKYKGLVGSWEKNSFKLEKDPRITRVGRFLRRFSIDEFPQLLNVIKGDMSLVGPRALYPEEMKMQRKLHSDLVPFLDLVTHVKPGASGVWQVSGRSALSFRERVKIDAEYAKGPTLLTDLAVILKTPFAILGGKGAR
ncbi:MAG: hypothetical protein A3F35_02685 [Candidatus Woykebacteria bacterium RIFCSPHIGHO2_12_FULL_45_10]|uniref:Bacterial sugar transferase domain-containing protein n=1 Tax=Candidatus Woykebacteria bacterium RIFCSPHIGHO2_12_FULL_45_10 TaxID=1802603 RepID=A0A1G1WMU1_9BACT|nr:MAG: hypothetical protein A3F35_02685 [Candidatus Woykebacteria bacterium RIFCSPHIGHO2_12_FULL_45_10]